MLNLNYVKMKKMRFLLVLLVGISIVSCTNDLDEMLGTQNLQTRSVEPRFTGNISERYLYLSKIYKSILW